VTGPEKYLKLEHTLHVWPVKTGFKRGLGQIVMHRFVSVKAIKKAGVRETNFHTFSSKGS